MLEPLAVDPNRSVAPAANNMASARLVFPAPAGPTSAITRVPLDGCPAIRLSLRPVHGRASRSLQGRRAPSELPPSACFRAFARAAGGGGVPLRGGGGGQQGWGGRGAPT